MGTHELRREGTWGLGICIIKLESESISLITQVEIILIESSCMSLRAQDNVEVTKRVCSPNKQAEMSV